MVAQCDSNGLPVPSNIIVSVLKLLRDFSTPNMDIQYVFIECVCCVLMSTISLPFPGSKRRVFRLGNQPQHANFDTFPNSPSLGGMCRHCIDDFIDLPTAFCEQIRVLTNDSLVCSRSTSTKKRCERQSATDVTSECSRDGHWSPRVDPITHTAVVPFGRDQVTILLPGSTDAFPLLVIMMKHTF